jgi:tRNA (guanine37-N1)-methyltransferase
MLTFHVITLFPELIETYCSSSILGRGKSTGRFVLKTYNPRDFCHDKYRKVDDTPYGGGAGMLLKPEPIFACVESIQEQASGPVVFLSPHGQKFSQDKAACLAQEEHIIIICGHYEGIDERIKTLVTEEMSLGDFVVTGGELPALAVIDSVGRLIPGVLGKQSSLADESFVDGLLEAPQYTKPAVYRAMEVPEILRSGNHKAVAKWRREESLRVTFERRPELLSHAQLDDQDKKFLENLRQRK